jgi:hypothetical protein
MCSRQTLDRAICIASCGVLLASAGQAQSTAQLRARAERVLLIVARADSLASRARRVDSASYAPTDTVTGNGFLVLVPKRYRQMVDSAAVLAAREFHPELRENIESVAREVVMVMYRSGDKWTIDSAGAARAGRTRTEFIPIDSTHRSQYVAELLLERISSHLKARLDTSARNWIGNWMPLRRQPLSARENVYTMLVSQHSTPARKCLAGDISLCAVALRIVPVKDSVLEWYNATDRRELIRQRLDAGYLDARLVEGCMGGDDEMCTTAVRTLERHDLPHPARENALELFMETVLRAGGPTSLQRFLADSLLPLPQRIERAAGKPFDTLIREWRSNLMSVRPQSPWPNGAQRWMTFAAVFGIAVAALSRRGWV